MGNVDMATYAKNTWCPGCGNFGILAALKEALKELSRKHGKENIVMVGGIGCHAKILDYVNVNSFYGLHGRTLPVMTGIKLANPKLQVIGFAGDGDAYAEGIGHLIHAAKRNTDVTAIVHNNGVFALTTGQATPTAAFGFVDKSTPQGNLENPINPVKLMLAAGATFVARAYAGDIEFLKEIILKAVAHKGFSFIDVLQPCVSFNNTFALYNKKVYRMKGKLSFDEAMKKADETEKIPIGIFYEHHKDSYEEVAFEKRNLLKS